MKTLRIQYPQLVMASMDIIVSDDLADQLLSKEIDQADFVYKQLGQMEEQWLPAGKRSLENAYEYGYAKITEIF